MGKDAAAAEIQDLVSTLIAPPTIEDALATLVAATNKQREKEKKQRQRKDGKVDKPPGLGRSKPKGGKAKESKQRNEGGRKSGNSRPPANGTAAADGVDGLEQSSVPSRAAPS